VSLNAGGNLGASIGAGSDGYDISVRAGVNAGKGYKNGNGLTHTDPTLNAGNYPDLTAAVTTG